MKNIIIILFALFVSSAYAQDSATCSKGSRIPTPKKQFVSDSISSNFRLYVIGGIAAVIKPKDKDFAEKSGFQYHDFGCLAPADMSFYVTYNQMVLEHLNKKLPQDWQKEVIVNTIGLKEWRKRQ